MGKVDGEGAGEEGGGEEGGGEGPPKTRAQLLLAIANPLLEFGLLKKAPTALAAPAFKALKAMCMAKRVNVPEAAVARKRGASLPEDFFIVKVSTARPTQAPNYVSRWSHSLGACIQLCVPDLHRHLQSGPRANRSQRTFIRFRCSRACG